MLLSAVFVAVGGRASTASSPCVCVRMCACGCVRADVCVRMCVCVSLPVLTRTNCWPHHAILAQAVRRPPLARLPPRRRPRSRLPPRRSVRRRTTLTTPITLATPCRTTPAAVSPRSLHRLWRTAQRISRTPRVTPICAARPPASRASCTLRVMRWPPLRASGIAPTLLAPTLLAPTLLAPTLLAPTLLAPDRIRITRITLPTDRSKPIITGRGRCRAVQCFLSQPFASAWRRGRGRGRGRRMPPPARVRVAANSGRSNLLRLPLTQHASETRGRSDPTSYPREASTPRCAVSRRPARSLLPFCLQRRRLRVWLPTASPPCRPLPTRVGWRRSRLRQARARVWRRRARKFPFCTAQRRGARNRTHGV
jgi:hypothetical protein